MMRFNRPRINVDQAHEWEIRQNSSIMVSTPDSERLENHQHFSKTSE